MVRFLKGLVLMVLAAGVMGNGWPSRERPTALEVPEQRARFEQVQDRPRTAEAERARAEHGPRPEEREVSRAAVEAARA